MTSRAKPVRRRTIVAAAVTPLVSMLWSGLLIIVPVLERTLGALAVFAIGICLVVSLVGTVIRHNVIEVEAREAEGKLDAGTKRLGRVADAVIVVAYVISVAQYLVKLFASSAPAFIQVRYLGDDYDAPARVRASRLA